VFERTQTGSDEAATTGERRRRSGSSGLWNRSGIPPSLHRCLASTNLIESPQSSVRMRTRRVCRWRDAAMVQRWAAASFLATEKNFRRIMGWKDLWQLETILGRKVVDAATMQEVA